MVCIHLLFIQRARLRVSKKTRREQEQGRRTMGPREFEGRGRRRQLQDLDLHQRQHQHRGLHQRRHRHQDLHQHRDRHRHPPPFSPSTPPSPSPIPRLCPSSSPSPSLSPPSTAVTLEYLCQIHQSWPWYAVGWRCSTNCISNRRLNDKQLQTEKTA